MVKKKFFLKLIFFCSCKLEKLLSFVDSVVDFESIGACLKSLSGNKDDPKVFYVFKQFVFHTRKFIKCLITDLQYLQEHLFPELKVNWSDFASDQFSYSLVRKLVKYKFPVSDGSEVLLTEREALMISLYMSSTMLMVFLAIVSFYHTR